MGKVVEIERSVSQCRMCIDVAESYDQMPPCSECEKQTGEWIDTVSNFWGTYAIVEMKDGSVEKIPLSRIKVKNRR